MKPTLEEQLGRAFRDELTHAERAQVWVRVEEELRRVPHASPYTLFTVNIFSRPMIGILIALIVLVGGGATVAASDNARPGDTLFPVDTTVERVRLAFAAGDAEANLRVRFADERVREVESLIDEARDRAKDEEVVSADRVGLIEAEADIFTNETVVKVEINGAREMFTTDATLRAEIVAEIAARYSVAEADVEAILVLEVEDRESRPEDKRTGGESDDEKGPVSGGSAARVSYGLEVAIAALNENLARFEEGGNDAAVAALQAVIERLNQKLADTPTTLRAKIKVGLDDRTASVEAENDASMTGDAGKLETIVADDAVDRPAGESRVRIEYKDDGIKVKIERETLGAELDTATFDDMEVEIELEGERGDELDDRSGEILDEAADEEGRGGSSGSSGDDSGDDLDEANEDRNEDGGDDRSGSDRDRQ